MNRSYYLVIVGLNWIFKKRHVSNVILSNFDI